MNPNDELNVQLQIIGFMNRGVYHFSNPSLKQIVALCLCLCYPEATNVRSYDPHSVAFPRRWVALSTRNFKFTPTHYRAG
jgi:hypothetical protein